MVTEVSLICDVCGKSFQRRKAEYERNLRRGLIRKFCSRSCSCKLRNKLHPPKPSCANHLKPDNRRDEFTPFRYYLRKAIARDKKKNQLNKMNLTLESLKKLWDDQKGLCLFSQKKMILPENCEGWKDISPYSASLDRIDNNIGYIQENVRFISFMANVARRTFSDEDVIDFCQNVAINNGPKF